MRSVASFLVLLCFSISASAQFSSRIDTVFRDGDDLQVEFSVARSGGCNPRPEFSAEAGAPPGAEIPGDAASFKILIHQPRATCTRAFRMESASLKLRVGRNVTTLYLFVPSLPHLADKEPFELLKFDLAKARRANP